MAKKIEDAIEQGPEVIKPVSFILTRLWRRLLRESNMTVTRFNELMTIFTFEPGLTRKQETDRRGKLGKSLASTNVSLRTLITGLRMLKATRVTLTMRVEFQDRPSVEVAEMINFHHPIHNPEPSQTRH